MARSVLFLALVVLALVGSAVASPQLLTRLRYRNWKLTNGKSYTEAEDEYRFRVFSQNMERVRLLNEQTNSTRYELGPFADLTEEEFLEMPCGGDLTKLAGESAEVSEFKSNGLAAPASFDWRDKGAVTPVKNQGQCGSCWAFSAIANVEGVNFLSGRKLQGFAEQQYVDCGKQSFGCGGGWPYWAFQDQLQYQQGGLESEASYPYTARNGQCSYDSGESAVTLRNYKSYCTTSTAKCDENQMKDMLTQLGPLSVCLNATPMQFYSSGVDDPTSCSPTMINHCVLLAGYGTDSASGKDYWLIKNSWGTSWGEQGYYRLVRGKGACGINTAITVAQV